jgi:hypothetical protein
MRIRGIKFICDRCGAEKFYELNFDGEFKEECTFRLFDLNNDTYLCGDCYAKYTSLVKRFMEEAEDDGERKE